MSAITSKGQVTIPKAIRDRLGIRPGDHVEFVESGGQIVLRKQGQQLTAYKDGRDLFGKWSSGQSDTSSREVRKAVAARAIQDEHEHRPRR